MKKVTDPALLEQLEGKKVTDPEILKQLESQDNAVVQTIKNVPSSAKRMFEGIATAVMHPVQTAGGLIDLAAGGLQKAAYSAVPGLKPTEEGFMYSPRAEATANAVGQFYKDRYGGMENLRNTVVTDPVGFAADASAVIGLGGLGLRAAGFKDAAKTASTISRYTDPLYLTGKAATTVAKPAYRQIVGHTTGAGSKVIDQALKGDQAFVDAMRGKTSEAEVVQKVKDSLDDIREARGAAYRSKLEGLKANKKNLNIDDVKQLADDQLSRFNVKKVDDALDFSRSTASGKSASEIEEVYKLVQDWGSQVGDNTPAMLDVLKRRLDDFYAEGRTSRAMVTTLKKAVQDKIVKAVPEYAEMTKDYAKTTEMIQEMEKALGAGKRTAADTALRKIIMAVKEDKGFRRDLLKTLGDGENLIAEASGVTMNPLISRSLGSAVTTGAGVTGLALVSPKLAALMALASPRLVGELSVALGKSGKLAPYGRGAGILAYQAGRLPLED